MRGMPSDGRSLLYHAYRLQREIGSLLDAALVDAPLDATEYAIYSAVFEAEPVTPKVLGAELAMPAQTVSDWIAVLRSRGHLRSGPNPRDGRSVLLWLTAEGRRAHRETSVPFEGAYRAFVQELPAGEGPAMAAVIELVEAVQRARAVTSVSPPAPARPGVPSPRRSEVGHRAGAARTSSRATSRPAK